MATASRLVPDPRAPAELGQGPVRHRLTVEDYYRMADVGILVRGKRMELIDGEIIDMSPIGVLHAAVVNVLARYFSRHLGESTFVSCQNPLRLDDENEPEPDLMVLRPRSDCYSTAHPGPGDTLLVIEVADTSLAYDLNVKVPLYARCGVPEVWVIEAETRRTHVFRTPVKDSLARVTYGDCSIIEADAPLPFARIGSTAHEALNTTLTHLLPPTA